MSTISCSTCATSFSILTVAGTYHTTWDANVLLEVRTADKSADEDDVEGGDDDEDEKSWLIVIGDYNDWRQLKTVENDEKDADDCHPGGETEEGGELLEQDEQSERLFLRAPRVVRRLANFESTCT